MQKPGKGQLIQQAAITVLFTYVLLVGGTLNGLVLYEALNLSLGLLALVAAAWLGWAWIRRQPILFSPLVGFYGIFLAAYAVAAVFSLDPRRSLNALCLTTLYALVWVLVSDLLSKGWSAESFTRVMLFVASGVIGLALWQTIRYGQEWLAIIGGDPLLPPVILRPNPLLTHANMVAAFLNMLWPLALTGLLATGSWPRRIVAALWILLAWTVILLTSSRGAFLGTAAALLVTAGLWWSRREKSGRQIRFPHPRFSLGWLAAGLVILLLLAGVGLVAARLLQNPTHGIGFSSRQHFWEAAWEAFVANPVTGLGPDTYATAYLRHLSIPPHTLYVRAHSQVMNLLAENGLLGILTGAALLAAVGWAAWRHWCAATVAERRCLAGVIGALVATAVHGLFDTPPAVPVNGLVIAVLLAILSTRPQPVERQRFAVWYRLVLTLLFLALLAVGVWSQMAYRPYLEGVALANSGNWEDAAPELEKAVARDPHHALYNLASGYAHGFLASQGDSDALPIAIQRYQAAIEREPAYGLNGVNLAALYWQQGDRTASIALMERAIQAAPQEATFGLSLGHYYEETGNLDGARGAYVQTLDLRPWWAHAYYWRENDFRFSVRDAWQTDHSAGEPQTVLAAAQAARAEARFDQALVLYDQVLEDNPYWPGVYVERAETLLALGRYSEASRDAQIAAFIGGQEPATVAWSDWVLAKIAYSRGDLDTALTLGERSIDAYRQQSIFGPGTYGTSLYGWAIYYRLTLIPDMLPQLVTIRYTTGVLNRLQTLGAWYEEAGDVVSAREIYREALAAEPDALWAEQRLQELGP